MFEYIKSDLYRYTRSVGFKSFCKTLFFVPGMKYSFFMRITASIKKIGWFGFPIYVICRLILNHYQIKYGIHIPYNTKIDMGLYIGHYGGIVINSDVQIGRNCNINHGVTIGVSYGGKNPGTPEILNNVYFGTGCKVFGGIVVGNNVAIGANCVVNKSVPDNAVVVGVPGQVVSYSGSDNYIVNCVEEIS